MTNIRRVDFIHLSGITREIFDTRARRQQFTFLNDSFTPSDELRVESGRRVYRAFDALVTAVGDQLALLGVPQGEACVAMVYAQISLRGRWDDLQRSLVDPDAPHVVVGIRRTLRGWQMSQAFVCKADHIGFYWKGPETLNETTEGLAVASATVAAKQMDQRAQKVGIDLTAFWADPDGSTAADD